MALQLSTTVRNARLYTIESTIGVSAVLKLRTGSAPVTCATADSGTVVSTITLPSDWMNAASSGSKTLLGTWQKTNTDNTGTVGYFRLYASDGTTCHMQGTVTVSGGGGDLTLDSVTVTAGQTITITSFTLTDANA